MARVEVFYQDFRENNNQGRFIVESDQAMNPYTWKPPIHWEGYIKEVKISFTQIRASGSSERDYDFSKLPEQFHRFIPEIVEAIDNAMRVMD